MKIKNLLLSAILTLSPFVAFAANNGGKFTNDCISWYGQNDIPCYNVDNQTNSSFWARIFVNGQMKGVGLLQNGYTSTIADKVGGGSVIVNQNDNVQFQLCHDAACKQKIGELQTFNPQVYGYRAGFTCTGSGSSVSCQQAD